VTGSKRAGVLASVLAGVLGCGEEQPPEPPAAVEAAIGPPRTKTILIGIDGATWDVIDPMIANGELPTFQELALRGARGSLLALPPLSSPVVWTTVATGTFARQHEILGFTYPFSGGAGRPVSSDLRQDPALWNVATAYGRSVGVVGWFVSHPAEIVDGFVVSDRLVHEAPGSTYPAALQGDAERTLRDVRALPGLLSRFLPWDYRPEAADDPSDPYHRPSLIVRGRVDDVVVRDETFRRIALERLDEPTDLFAVYFRLVDHACHATWLYYDDTDFDEPADPAEKALLGGIVLESYRWMDDMLRSLVDALDASGIEANLIIVSDHGFGSATKDYQVRPGMGVVLSGNHRSDGIFLAAGPDVRPGRVDGLTTLDVTPLVATLVGLPLAEDLPGRLEPRVLRADYFDEHPLVRVESWATDWSSGRAVEVPKEAELEMLAELEALGYVDDFGDELDAQFDADRPARSELDFWQVARGNRELALTGELAYYALQGDAQRARGLLALVERKDPEVRAILPGRARQAVEAMATSLGRERRELVDPEFWTAIGLEADAGASSADAR